VHGLGLRMDWVFPSGFLNSRSLVGGAEDVPSIDGLGDETRQCNPQSVPPSITELIPFHRRRAGRDLWGELRNAALRRGRGRHAVCGNGVWLRVGSALAARRKEIGALRGGRGRAACTEPWMEGRPAFAGRAASADCGRGLWTACWRCNGEQPRCRGVVAPSLEGGQQRWKQIAGKPVSGACVDGRRWLNVA
jgi:hypothetical protein